MQDSICQQLLRGQRNVVGYAFQTIGPQEVPQSPTYRGDGLRVRRQPGSKLALVWTGCPGIPDGRFGHPTLSLDWECRAELREGAVG